MKVKPMYCFLILVYTLLHFSLLVSLNYNFELLNMEKISNSFYDKNSIFFSISNIGIDFEGVYDALPNDTVIYCQLPANDDIRGVLYKGQYDAPDMKEGRFFSKSDFSGNSKLAVVGSEISTIKEKGNEYYEYNGVKYDVMGIIGYSMPTKLDRTVMLTLNNDLLKFDSKYIISGSDLQKNLNFLGREELFGQVVVYDNDKPNILHIVDVGYKQIITSVLFVLVIIFNSYLVTYFWIDKENDELNIKKMNGYNNRQLRMEFSKKVLIMCIISVILGTGMTILIFRNQFMLKPEGIFISALFMIMIEMLYFVILIEKTITKLNKKKLGVSN